MLYASQFFTILLFVVVNTTHGQGVKEYGLDSFHEIRVAQPIEVHLIQGRKEKVKVTVEKGTPDMVLVRVLEGRLRIYIRGNSRNINAKVYITYINLDAILASSASKVYSKSTIKGDKLDVNVSSVAHIAIAVDVKTVRVTASSSGNVQLKGKAQELFAMVSSAANVNAIELEANNVDVKVMTAANALVNAKETINAIASTDGNIRYAGNPAKCKSDSNSGGSVRKFELP